MPAEEITLLPLAVTVTRYECPFCKRRRSAKAATKAHMGRCWLNPDTRSCKTCAHLTEEPGEGPCFPGRPCNCNDGYRECTAGVEFDGNGFGPGFPVTGCPLWESRPVLVPGGA